MTYEYLCTACGHAWEAEQSISEKPLTQCPQCRTDNAKRQVSGGAGFILKGGGWYSDLYGSAPKKPAGEGSTEGAKTESTSKKDTGTSDAGSKATSDSGSSSTGTSGSSGSSSPAGSKPPGASAA